MKRKTRYIKAKRERRIRNQKSKQSRKNAAMPMTENKYLLANASLIYDSLYGLNRRDNGTGGGKQTAKHGEGDIC